MKSIKIVTIILSLLMVITPLQAITLTSLFSQAQELDRSTYIKAAACMATISLASFYAQSKYNSSDKKAPKASNKWFDPKRIFISKSQTKWQLDDKKKAAICHKVAQTTAIMSLGLFGASIFVAKK